MSPPKHERYSIGSSYSVVQQSKEEEEKECRWGFSSLLLPLPCVPVAVVVADFMSGFMHLAARMGPLPPRSPRPPVPSHWGSGQNIAVGVGGREGGGECLLMVGDGYRVAVHPQLLSMPHKHATSRLRGAPPGGRSRPFDFIKKACVRCVAHRDMRCGPRR